MAIALEDMLLPGPALDYASGTLSSGTVSVTGRIWSIRLFAGNGADASLTLAATAPTLSGDTITIRDASGIDINPRLRWQDLVITEVSGTFDYLVFFAA